MTKHAVEAFTKDLRGERAPHGIDVTKVNPGPYDTGFNDRLLNAIPEYLEEQDAAVRAIHAKLSEAVLPKQFDPAEVAIKLADLSEADETPEETFLPDGILDAIQAAV